MQIFEYKRYADLVEMLRALDYPRQLSIENFRSPNFALVAELLEWIVRRFDANARLSTVLTTEQDRVIFIKSVVLVLLQKARIKLNPKKLYQADGYAVQELLVAVRILFESTRQANDAESSATIGTIRTRVNNKIQEARSFRELASEIPQSGATLYDLLAKELLAREERLRALSFSMNLSDAEVAIKQAVSAIQEELAQVHASLENVSSDEAALDAKIDRKNKEYDQLEKRLAKLQSFRPQYMDEYEKHEKKLRQLYDIYVLKFRNVAFLQQLQSEYDTAEKQRNAEAEQNMRNMVERMRAEEIALRNTQIGELDVETEVETQSRAAKATKVYGNITGAGLSDDEEEEVTRSDLSEYDETNDARGNQQEDPAFDVDDGQDEKLEISSADDF